ncbi:MAG: LysR family transcriptional regulator [Peptococcaceae bacterium]|nr:LysR family transcriptional regulator [Peptococcaceae bacterium]
MRLEQLGWLAEIQRHSSLSGAAQALHISVQALSKSIAGMEDELGYVLLNRSSKGVALTDKAKRLVTAAEHFFDEMSDIHGGTAPQLPKLEGSYTVYSIIGEINIFLLNLLTTLSQDFPGLEIDTIRLSAETMVSAVADGEIDFGLYCAYAIDGEKQDHFPANVKFTPLLHCKLYAFVPASYRISVYHSVSIKSLLEFPLLFQRGAEANSPTLLNLVMKYGRPHSVIYKQSATLCQNLVTVGEGIYLCLGLASAPPQVNDPNRVKCLAIRDDIDITFGYLSNSSHTCSEVGKVILEYVHNQANHYTGY